MKEDWREYTIDDVAKIINGYAFKSKDFISSGVPIIKIKSLKDKVLVIDNGDFVDKDFLKLNEKYHIQYDDFVIAMTGSHITLPSSAVGRVAKSRHKEKLLLNQRVGKFKVKNKICDHNFLYYFLTTDHFFQNVGLRAKGAGNQANISNRDIGSIKIHLPPLPTQQKIADILSAYDDLIENNIKRIELLEEQAQLIYEEWFVRMKFPNHENTKIDAETGLLNGWTNTTLVEIAKVNANSISSSFDEDIEYIDISSVSTKSIDHTTKYPIKEAPGRAKRIITHGDIIWSCVRPNRKSYAVIWNPEENTIASTGFTVVSPTEVPTSFLYQVLGTEQFIAYLTNRATGAAYPAVKSIDFKEYVISLPPKSLIDKFDAQTKDYLDVIWNLKQQNEKLKEARDILLPRLMMGIIEV
ncbi:restriction endonuclease subunit S [Psychrobacter sp. Cmf 22.2]|uniref:restriction endonuclease subunit S n=1 Tax=Psychrobacter sp. Cmf 22.2 TaxID=1926478 RepID=UPI000946DF85|nr:restriction endonuclease subunit S [Psychrobacter sp. Cmf 22.2]OLF36748.1 hypothetical protein BTV98_10060 [Psychrobacter sp. Cmf 22.2]